MQRRKREENSANKRPQEQQPTTSFFKASIVQYRTSTIPYLHPKSLSPFFLFSLKGVVSLCNSSTCFWNVNCRRRRRWRRRALTITKTTKETRLHPHVFSSTNDRVFLQVLWFLQAQALAWRLRQGLLLLLLLDPLLDPLPLSQSQTGQMPCLLPNVNSCMYNERLSLPAIPSPTWRRKSLFVPSYSGEVVITTRQPMLPWNKSRWDPNVAWMAWQN